MVIYTCHWFLCLKRKDKNKQTNKQTVLLINSSHYFKKLWFFFSYLYLVQKCKSLMSELSALVTLLPEPEPWFSLKEKECLCVWFLKCRPRFKKTIQQCQWTNPKQKEKETLSRNNGNAIHLQAFLDMFCITICCLFISASQQVRSKLRSNESAF